MSCAQDSVFDLFTYACVSLEDIMRLFRLGIMIFGVLILHEENCIAQSDQELTTIRGRDLKWSDCGTCPEPPEVSQADDEIMVGIAGRGESSTQNLTIHALSALLPRAQEYAIEFTHQLNTWDSYNAPGTPNPPFNGGTGYWDSFSLSVSEVPYWDLSLQDPVTLGNLPGLGFIRGGTSFDDGFLETFSGSEVAIVPGNEAGTNYLNVTLDTATEPEANHAFPSWGSFSIDRITCPQGPGSVPLFKQGGPTAPWAENPYDDICKPSPTSSLVVPCQSRLTRWTMAEKGCATTSSAMLLAYHGVEGDPGILNAWLTENNGYDRNGNLVWRKVQEFSNNRVRFMGFGGSTLATLDGQMENCAPTIAREPGHFIIVRRRAGATFLINDPGFQRTTLSDRAYGNSTQGTRLFKPDPEDFSSIEIHSTANIHLTLTDTNGRRVGFDPTSGENISELPGSSFDIESLSDDLTGAPGPASNIIFVQNPSPGTYSLTVTATEDALFLIEIHGWDAAGQSQGAPVIIQNVVQGGEVLEYSLTYTKEPLDPATIDPGQIAVEIDIKPGSFPNPINTRTNKGKIPVAIFSTAQVDARSVDPATLSLSGSNPGASGVAQHHFEYVNDDDLLDLLVHFENSFDGIVSGDVWGFVTGSTFVGADIHGSDSVKTVPSKK